MVILAICTAREGFRMTIETLHLFWVPVVSGLLMALLCGLLGPFIVLKRLTLLTDTVAHASIFGVAVGVLLGVSAPWTLLPFSAGLGLFLSRFSRNDASALGNLSAVAFTLFLGMGTLLLSMKGISGQELVHLLFGDLLWIRLPDLFLLLGAFLVVSAFLFFRVRALMLLLANPDLARISGVKVEVLEDLFLIIVSLTVAICTKIVGVLLASALVILPPLIAASFASSFRSQLILSPLIGALGALLGIFLCLTFDLPFGPAISTLLGLSFVAASFFRRN
jgi:zinc transport system permease protein